MAKRPKTSPRKAVGASPAEDEDLFVARVFEVSTWAERNSQLLILAGIALALLLGGVVYYASYRRDLNRQAVAELERVGNMAAVAPPGETAQAEAELNSFVERFGGTRHAAEAELLLAQLQLRQGRAEQAVVTLEDFPRPDRDPLSLQAKSLLGRAYEELGRYQEAERAYLAVSDAASLEFERRDALADAARARSRSGNHAGAAELYRQILEGLDETHYERGLFEMRLAEEEQEARG
jgi:predicted negative regulator of RcsB-dependent stress response